MTDGEILRLDGYGDSIEPGDVVNHRPLELNADRSKVIKKGCWQGVAKILSIKYDRFGFITVKIIDENETPENYKSVGSIYVEAVGLFGPWKREFKIIRRHI